jgi:ketosteroid isomerase-like protein
MRTAIIISAVVIFAFNSFAQNSKDDAAIKDVVQRLVVAQTNYDQKAIDSLLTSDYIEISPLGEFDPREKVIGFYAPDRKPDPAKMTATVDITEYSIRNYGNIAVAIARFNYSMTSEGKPLPPRSIRATIVLKKVRSDWKIASAQYTGIRPPTPQQQTN